MEQREMEEIVRLVTEQVLSRTAACSGGSMVQEQDRLLAVGPAEAVPEDVAKGFAVCTIEDYTANKNILRYRRVVITSLTMAELADIAAGRDAGTAQSAVLQALLQGIEVYLCEEALPHRQYAGKGSRVLYAVLEGYAQTLRTYGVHPARLWQPKPEIPARPPRFQPPAMPKAVGSACPNSALVITEDAAKVLISSGGRQVRLPRGAIVTPSGWDVFQAGNVEIIKE